MKKQTFLITLILTATFQVCFGQGAELTQQEENWLRQYDIYGGNYLFFRYDQYSKEDTVNFRQKLDLLKNAEFGEWEGFFRGHYEETEFSQFRWDSDVGFVSFSIETCYPELRHVNYGRVVNSLDSIQIYPQFAANSPRKSTPVKYVKVKWNERRYLVEEFSLLAFAEKSVGIYVEPEDTSSESYQKWSNYWVAGDLEEDLTGLPEFPANYKNFQRLPIETKIISIGKRVIKENVEIGNTHYADKVAVYTVTVGAGKDKNVKAGVKFSILETGDEIVITQVNSKTSVGLIVRTTDDSKKNDSCHDENYEEIPCPKIKTSHKVETQVGSFLF